MAQGTPPYGAPPPSEPTAPYGAPPPTAYGAPQPYFGQAPTAATRQGAGQPNFFLAVLAGVVSAGLGAFLFGLISSAVGVTFGYLALAVGLMVGYAVHMAGGQLAGDIRMGIIGGVCGFVGCVGGYFVAIYMVFSSHGIVDVTLSDLWYTFSHVASPITYFLLAIGTYEGFKFGMGGTLGMGRRR